MMSYLRGSEGSLFTPSPYGHNGLISQAKKGGAISDMFPYDFDPPKKAILGPYDESKYTDGGESCGDRENRA